MMQAVYQAAAKINLALDILGRREDGYHLMRMVMQSVSLFDLVTLEVIPGASGIHLECSAPEIPCDSRNLAWKAAERLLEAAGIQAAVHISIEKNIPSQAGMAGGSADAAAVLAGLNEMLGDPLPKERLYETGLSVGADVPFCMAGGTKLVEGIGERISPLPQLPESFFIIAKPVSGVATGPCFQRYDRLSQAEHPDIPAMLTALQGGNRPDIFRHMKNVLEQAADCTAVAELQKSLAAFHPLGCAMTGSGSAVAAAFGSKAEAENCLRGLAHLREKGTRLFFVTPVPYGVLRI